MEQMEVSEPNQPLIDAKVYNSEEEFMNQVKNIPFASEGLEDLRNSPTAIVYFNVPCFTLKCAYPINPLFKCDFSNCLDDYTYHTLIGNSGELKYLYKSQGRLDCKICPLDLFCRFAHVKSSNIASFDQISSSEAGTESVEMLKEDNCTFCGMCSLFFPVNTKPSNTTIGFVKYRGFCENLCENICFPCIRCISLCKQCPCNPCNFICDYFYVCDVCSPEKQVVYSIYLKRCCIVCCPLDCLNSLSFSIRDSSGKDVGGIELKRACCVCNGLRGKNCTYTIQFPVDATPELKLTIINAVISIDMFLF